MTEEDAKKKWCPKAFTSHEHYSNSSMVVTNDENYGFEATRCKGSGCMMWRQWAQNDMEKRGYCGLAGKP